MSFTKSFAHKLVCVSSIKRNDRRHFLFLLVHSKRERVLEVHPFKALVELWKKDVKRNDWVQIKRIILPMALSHWHGNMSFI